ncbi:hypothetical protein KGQ20_10570 [Catenulispora sp. NF23]|uniref:RAMA domain-containing protein n=1 Tax=Catenulispora pinistramenti TaxID=2705254 RepID=A0ABS5KJZ8_9ACTN|nr:hypothetical protein [Catenulispora pinistramenti]MBS2533218.1 hypothetical protein [Catenulispora pinistramenti]MBS2546583.1 hypothetical protein [Catenulispora pinistramenti]
MARRKIEIDDEVWASLQALAIPFTDRDPNDVLRRVLLSRPPTPTAPAKPGVLLPLLKSGALRPGDRLVHHQPRKKRTFYAEVTDDGCLQIDDGRRFAEPSPALKAYVGREASGPREWVLERTGQRLGDLV